MYYTEVPGYKAYPYLLITGRKIRAKAKTATDCAKECIPTKYKFFQIQQYPRICYCIESEMSSGYSFGYVSYEKR